VKFNCECCKGQIEIDVSQLEPGEIRNIKCPHCESDTPIVSPPSDAEKEQYKLLCGVKVILAQMHECARNCFFGTGLKQSMFDTYKWIYAIRKLTEMTGVELKLNDIDEQELDSIGSMAVDTLTNKQIKEAHEEASKEIVSIIAGQTPE